MAQSGITGPFITIRDALLWAPAWLVGVVLLAVAAGGALALHRGLIHVLRHTFGRRHPFLRTVFHDTKGPAALALMVFFVSAAVQAAPFDPAVSGALTQLLLIAFVILLGWIAHVTVAVASDLYVRRFALDVDDNLLARKHVTQVRIFKRAIDTLIVVVTAAAALVTLPAVRQYGISLFASAGVAGLVVGLAARPLLSNLMAGVQIAMTQPIRIDDAVVVENEWGWVEEITATYVVIRLWDWRRLIVPLGYFIEKPFQNWTRETSAIIGTVLLHADYRVPVAAVRRELMEIAAASPLWDGRVVNLQVTEAREQTVELRALVSARTSPAAWDLRCEIRERLLAFLQREHPDALPRQRAEVVVADAAPTEQRAARRA